MTSDRREPGMTPDRRDTEAYLVIGLIGLLAVLAYFVLSPFLYYLLGAVVLAYITYPLYERIHEAVGNDSVSALLAILILLLVAVVPTLFMAEQVLSQGRAALVGVGTSTPAYIDTADLEAQILELTGESVDIDAAIRNAFVEAGQIVSGEIPNVISTLLDALIGLSVMAMTLYYLFKEGPTVVAEGGKLIPLSGARKEKLLADLESMSDAVLRGHLFTAAVQGVLAGIGLWAVGIPNAIFWTFVMIILGLIPLIGSFLVWGPAGIYLAVLKGEPIAGVALLIYGGILMSVVDNVVRAGVVGKRGRIHPLLVILGVIGGIAVFGLLGIILGPLVLGFLVVLLELYQKDFAQR